MGDLENDKSGKKLPNRIFTGYIRKGVMYTLLLSLAIFAVYLGGSLPDPGFTDRVLFFLLRFLRYSSLVLCVFSLIAMGFKINYFVYTPNVRNALKLLAYFFTGILGASLAMLNSFIIAAAGGHG